MVAEGWSDGGTYSGVYDRLVDGWLADQLGGLEARRLTATLAEFDPAELPDRVGEVVGEWVRSVLAGVRTDDRAALAVLLTEALLVRIAEVANDALPGDRSLTKPVRRLVAVERLAPTNTPITLQRPLTPLRDTVLMTNARGQPAIGHEIATEIDSADRIDLVLAFIRWTGLRELLAPFRRHVEAG